MRIIHSFLLFALVGTTSAQHLPNALPIHPQERDAQRSSVQADGILRAKEITYYEETFGSDLNGWVNSSPTGQLEWKWTNVGPGPTASDYPVPPLNSSTPGGWAIIDDDHDGIPGQNTESWLVSPPLDLSFAPQHVKLEFEQFFQEFNSDQTFVGVSINGGNTWNEVEVNEGVGRDDRPNPELIDVDISEWLSGDRTNVVLRFRYVAVWDYGWQIDNIAIRDQPMDDMALLQANITAFDFDNTGFEQMDYSIYPFSQLTTLYPNVVVRNKGYIDQTGVSVTLSVDGPIGTLLNASSPPMSFTAGTEQTLALDPILPGSVEGQYDVSFNVDQDSADMVLQNNTRSGSFAVSSNIYAHDDGVVRSFQRQGPDHEDQPFEVGSHFMMVADGMLTALQVAFHPNTPVGSIVYGAIYDPSPTTASHPSLIDLTDDHTLTASEISTVGGSLFTTLTFNHPVELLAGTAYLVVVGSTTGTQGVHFATSGASAAQVSIIHYPSAPSAFEFYITRTPMVRMVLAGEVGLEEHSLGTTPMRFTPNPSAGPTTLAFDMLEPGHASIQVHDIAGRTVHENDLGLRPVGAVRMDLDASAWPAGMYTCVLSTGSSRTVSKLVVQH